MGVVRDEVVRSLDLFLASRRSSATFVQLQSFDHPTGSAAVEARLDSARAEAAAILRANRHMLDALAEALLERDELIGDEIIDVLHSAQRAEPHEIVIPDVDRDHDAPLQR
jgi:hypothetical protein